jgi:RNA polymerase-binding protein DksA
MSHLTQQQKQHIAQQLRGRESDLHAGISGATDKNEEYRQIAGEVPDAGDVATADVIRELDQAEASRDIAELRAVQRALQRMRDEDYGACVDCGDEIPVERLTAQPTAVRCVDCQALRERNYAGRGRGGLL